MYKNKRFFKQNEQLIERELLALIIHADSERLTFDNNDNNKINYSREVMELINSLNSGRIYTDRRVPPEDR